MFDQNVCFRLTFELNFLVNYDNFMMRLFLLIEYSTFLILIFKNECTILYYSYQIIQLLVITHHVSLYILNHKFVS